MSQRNVKNRDKFNMDKNFVSPFNSTGRAAKTGEVVLSEETVLTDTQIRPKADNEAD